MGSKWERFRNGATILLGLLVAATLITSIATLVRVGNVVDYDSPARTESDLHINPAPVVKADKDSRKFEACSSYAKTLKQSLNFTFNPCSDFHSYVCAGHKGPSLSGIAIRDNLNELVKALKREQRVQYAKKAQHLFASCIAAQNNRDLIFQNGSQIRNIYQQVHAHTQLSFPALDGNHNVPWPSATELATIIGYLSANFELDTMLSTAIAPDWKNPAPSPKSGQKAFRLYVDQANTMYSPKLYESGQAFVDKDYEKTKLLVMAMAKVLKKDVNETVLDETLKGVQAFEKSLALEVNENGVDRRNYSRLFHLTTVPDVESVISFSEFFRQLSSNLDKETSTFLKSRDFQFVLMERTYPKKLGSMFSSYNNSATTLFNYLNIRLVRKLQDLLPTKIEKTLTELAEKRQTLERSGLFGVDLKLIKDFEHGNDDNELKCALEVVAQLPIASSAMFLRQVFPDAQSLNVLKSYSAQIATESIDGLEYLIDQLNWMPEQTKKEAYDKLKYAARIIAYNEWILNDKKVNNFYYSLKINDSQSYVEIEQGLRLWNRNNRFRRLTQCVVPRDEFTISTLSTSAVHEVTTNALNVPVGLLRAPFLSSDLPSAVNFGGLGCEVGKGIGHSFDEEGVQFDGEPKMRNWLDDVSQTRFHDMLRCLGQQNAQLDKFGTDYRSAIADSAGLHAAYVAFQAHQAYYGLEERLPDAQLSQFDNNQLFFLSYARRLCEDLTDEEENVQLLTAVNPPNRYRLIASLQNLPAFAASFNCPAGSFYAPRAADRCDVWTSTAGKVVGVPDRPTRPPDAHIPSAKPNLTDSYKWVGSEFSSSINPQKSPCDDFHAYACSGKNRSTSLVKEAEARIVAVVSDYLEDLKPKELIAKNTFEECQRRRFGRSQFDDLTSEFRRVFNVSFPLLQETPAFPKKLPTLGNLTFFLSREFDLHPFYKLEVRPNLKKKFNSSPYILHLGQPEMTFKQDVYIGSKWTAVKKEYTVVLIQLLRLLKADLDENQARVKIEEALELEQEISKILRSREVLHPAEYNPLRYHDVIVRNTYTDLPAYNMALYKAYKLDIPNILSYIINRQTLAVEEFVGHHDNIAGAFANVLQQDPARVFNMIYLRLLFDYQSVLSDDVVHLSATLANSLKRRVFQRNAKQHKSLYCAEAIGRLYPPIFTRMAVAATYDDYDNWQKHQATVSQVVDAVVDSFANSIRSLSWMSRETKEKALFKIDTITRTIGTADWIFNTTYLNDIYRDVPALTYLSFATHWTNSNRHKHLAQIKRLVTAVDLQREELGSDVSGWALDATVSRDLNSLGIPLSLMQTPVFNANYPTYWNFATVGVTIGNLLGHLFDRNGLERDASGEFNDWLDAKSKEEIKVMLAQLGEQYKRYGVELDGDLDEHLAENSALQAAFQGYKRFVSVYGEEDRLPDPLLAQLTPQQVFFLAYGNQFCGGGETKMRGALSNSEQFRATYNCPTGSRYAPFSVVRVWLSEPEVVIGEPDVPKPAPSLHIDANQVDKSEKRMQCAKQLERAIDNTADPCEDFVQYACGQYDMHDTFTEVQLRNEKAFMEAMRRPAEENQSRPERLQRLHFDKCRKEFQRDNRDPTQIIEIVAEVERVLGQPIPLLAVDPTSTASKKPSAEDLGRVLGFLSGRYASTAVIDAFVDTNVANPSKGYTVVLGADTDYNLALRRDDNETNIVYDGLVILGRFLKYARNDTLHIQDYVVEQVRAMIEMETLLFEGLFPSEDVDRKNFSDVYTTMNLQEAEQTFEPSIDLKAFLAGFVSEIPEAVGKVTSDKFEVMVYDKKQFQNLFRLFSVVRKMFSADNILNYILYRSLDIHSQWFLPVDPDALGSDIEPTSKINKWWRRRRRRNQHKGVVGRAKHPLETTNPALESLGFNSIDRLCLYLTNDVFTEVANYKFVKTFYANLTQAENDRKSVAKFIDGIILGFRGMLNQLSWMDGESKANAYYKIDQVIKNVAYPNSSVDLAELDKYYKALKLDENVSFNELYKQMLTFNQKKTVALLMAPTADRLDFGQAFTLNAWYNPEANSITLPLSILQQPFYDPDWPQAVNFGAIGAVAGHELTHGFDDQGVQFDAAGRLHRWMDERSFGAFLNMTACVAEQYDAFCYADGACVDGGRTLGENIADNGGIRAAFRAYRNAVAFRGQDARLAGPLVGQLSADQLFFLAFGRVWCQVPLQGMERDWALSDVHAPAPFRVLGSLRNFPAFRQAFHCPVNATYAPQQHCNVWVTDVDSSLSVPSTTSPVPPLNIDPAPTASKDNDAFNDVARSLSLSIDVEQAPCNNFYDYVCGQLNTSDTTIDEEATLKTAQILVRGLEKDLSSVAHADVIANFYGKCVQARSNPIALKESIEFILKQFEGRIGVKFPAFTDDPQDYSNDYLEKGIGSLIGQHGVDNLLSVQVQLNLEATPDVHPVHLLHIGGPVLSHPATHFDQDRQRILKPGISARMTEIFDAYAKLTEQNNVDIAELVEQIYYTEYVVAQVVAKASFNALPFNQNIVTLLNLTAVNQFKWNVFFQNVLSSVDSEVWSLFLDANGQLVDEQKVSAVGVNFINGLLEAVRGNGLTDADLANYFYFRVLWEQRDILLNSPDPELPPDLPATSATKLSCALSTRRMKELNSRLFIDSSQLVFHDLHQNVASITTNVLTALQSEIERTSWLEDDARMKAVEKLSRLQIKLLGDVRVLNNTYLDEIYSDYRKVAELTNFGLTLETQRSFELKTLFRKLKENSTDFTGFALASSETRPRYDYTSNTLTIPTAAALAPLYDPEYPSSVHFGSLDLTGVELDESGHYTKPSDNTVKAYNNISSCLIRQHSEFCPLDRTSYTHNCLNLTNSVNEALADHSAVHSAHLALEQLEDFRGADPAFNHNLLGRFSDDQLFFIAYARRFCQRPKSDEDILMELLTSKYIPPEYRVKGALQNTRAFRSAFNCPPHSAYVRNETCDVFTGNGVRDAILREYTLTEVILQIDSHKSSCC